MGPYRHARSLWRRIETHGAWSRSGRPQSDFCRFRPNPVPARTHHWVAIGWTRGPSAQTRGVGQAGAAASEAPGAPWHSARFAARCFARRARLMAALRSPSSSWPHRPPQQTRTATDAHRERQLVGHVPAASAGLRSRKEPIGGNGFAAVPGSLVSDEAATTAGTGPLPYLRRIVPPTNRSAIPTVC